MGRLVLQALSASKAASPSRVIRKQRPLPSPRIVRVQVELGGDAGTRGSAEKRLDKGAMTISLTEVGSDNSTWVWN